MNLYLNAKVQADTLILSLSPTYEFTKQMTKRKKMKNANSIIGISMYVPFKLIIPSLENIPQSQEAVLVNV